MGIPFLTCFVNDTNVGVCICYNLCRRGVAQPGSVLAWGASGRRFKSSRPDQLVLQYIINEFIT